MRKTVGNMIDELLSGLKEAEMHSAAEAMGTSMATAYRYRKSPLDMPLKSFIGLVGHFDLHVDMSVTLHQEELLEAERLRLQLEKNIAKSSGYRLVTTPHFTVNCELPEVTKIKFEDRYDSEFWDEIEEFTSLRNERRKLYLNGNYDSTEIVNGDAYIDFFLKRNLFLGIDEVIWKKQYESILETNEMKNVHRYIYLRSTPELPVILCFSCGDTIIRLSDLTIKLSKEHLEKSKNTLKKFIPKCKYQTENDVRSFLINPIKMGSI